MTSDRFFLRDQVTLSSHLFRLDQIVATFLKATVRDVKVRAGRIPALSIPLLLLDNDLLVTELGDASLMYTDNVGLLRAPFISPLL